MPTILMTGAAGRIGTMLRTRLARPGRTLRLLDVAPLTAGTREEVIRASVTDLDAMTAACQRADALIHLGGYAGRNTGNPSLTSTSTAATSRSRPRAGPG